MNADIWDRWLGQPITEVPQRLQARVFEHIFGTDLPTLASYAADKARYLLGQLDPDMRDDYEDIAQDVLVGLTDTLPRERIRHWRALLVQELRWRIIHLRRARLAAKRHPGQRVGLDTVADFELAAVEDVSARVIGRDVILTAIAKIAHHETRAVLAATFVIAADGSYCDVRTTEETAAVLGMSREKVKRLRAAGIKVLRPILREDLGIGEELDFQGTR